jgi:transcriptional regulator with XRE-family HTH domain
MRRQDPSLGGSIRRLRLQRGLKQSDYPTIPARTIGRIERGEVENPRLDTLQRIASRLEVAVDDLGSF